MRILLILLSLLFAEHASVLTYPDGSTAVLRPDPVDRNLFYLKGFPVLATGSLFYRGDEPISNLESKYDMGFVRNHERFGYSQFVTAGDTVEIAGRINSSGDGYAFPDLARRVVPLELPDDPFVPRMWHLENPGSVSMFQEKITVSWAADIGFFDAVSYLEEKNLMPEEWIDVAVADTGVAPHPEFEDRIREGFNNFDDDGEDPDGLLPEEEYSYGGHGTGCAGIIAAAMNNATGGTGICPGCGIVPVRIVKASGSYLSSKMIMDTFDFIMDQQQVGVVNCSYGSDAGGNTVPLLPGELEVYRKFMKQARGGKGGAIVFAAGNSRESTYWHELMNSEPGLFIVGSSTAWDAKASYSNYGEAMDLVAPSMSFFPAQVALTTTAPVGNGNFEEDYFEDFGGTSASTPVVSGALAFLFSVNPDLTLEEAEEILFTSADRIMSDLGWYDVEDDFGVKSPVFGYGRINLERAVRLATGDDMCENPAAEETCGNGIDDDCNTLVDDGCFVSVIGRQCEKDADCRDPGYENALCLHEFLIHTAEKDVEWVYPGGYCTVECEKETCPGGSRCIRNDDSVYDRTGNSGAMCFLECSLDHPCPEGLLCNPEEAVGLPDDVTGVSKCIPDPDWEPGEETDAGNDSGQYDDQDAGSDAGISASGGSGCNCSIIAM